MCPSIYPAASMKLSHAIPLGSTPSAFDAYLFALSFLTVLIFKLEDHQQ